MIFFFLVVGVAVGSFLLASAWRIHKQQSLRSAKSKDKYSITKGRSMCEHCGHTLSVKDLIPVVSWVTLRGKCRYCDKKLSWEYPLAELITGILYALSFTAWEFVDTYDYISFGIWLVILSMLILLAIYDLKWLILPNKIIYPLIILAAVTVIFKGIYYGGDPEVVKDSVLGLLFIGGVFYLLFTISKGKWIGGGDVKLGIFMGVYLGLSRSFLAFILAFNIAALVIIPLLLFGIVSRKTPIPFGPFLIVATVVSMLYGYDLIQWYSDTFLYGLV